MPTSKTKKNRDKKGIKMWMMECPCMHPTVRRNKKELEFYHLCDLTKIKYTQILTLPKKSARPSQMSRLGSKKKK